MSLPMVFRREQRKKQSGAFRPGTAYWGRRRWWLCRHLLPLSNSRTPSWPQKGAPHLLAVIPEALLQPLTSTSWLSISVDMSILGISYMISNSVWLILLGMRFSRLIHAVTCVSPSFLYTIVWIWPLFVYPFFHRWTFGLFHFCAFRNVASANIYIMSS